MSFWDLSTEDKAATSYEAPSGGGGGDWYFADGQELICVIENVTKKETKAGRDYFSIQWGVVGPEKDAKGITIKNRKVFQSIYPEGSDYDDTQDKQRKTVEKARRFMLAIDGQCGHKVFGKGGAPTAERLLADWSFTRMKIRVGLMKNRETKVPERNYVQAIGADVPESQIVIHEGVWANAAKPAQNVAQTQTSSTIDDDSIPF